MSTCHKSQFSRLIDCLKNEKDELEFGFLRVQYHSNHLIPFSLFREQPFKMLRVFSILWVVLLAVFSSLGPIRKEQPRKIVLANPMCALLISLWRP